MVHLDHYLQVPSDFGLLRRREKLLFYQKKLLIDEFVALSLDLAQLLVYLHLLREHVADLLRNVERVQILFQKQVLVVAHQPFLQLRLNKLFGLNLGS